MGKMFLVIVCAHSKWPEVFALNDITSAGTIQALRKCFAAYGIPEQIVSDNGPNSSLRSFPILLTAMGLSILNVLPITSVVLVYHYQY